MVLEGVGSGVEGGWGWCWCWCCSAVYCGCIVLYLVGQFLQLPRGDVIDGGRHHGR